MQPASQDAESPPSSTPSETTTEEAPDQPAKRTLGEILALCRQADDAILESEVDLEELGKDLRNKVDDVTEYVDFCESRRLKIMQRAAELSTKAVSFGNKADHLCQYVALNMAGTGTEKLSGNFYRFLIRTGVSVKEKIAKVLPIHALKYKGLIRVSTSYALDKKALKPLLQKGDPRAMEIAQLVESKNLDIKPISPE